MLYQYDPYQMSLGYTQPVVTHFSIDVECVATGTDHNSRSVAQIALVVSTTDYLTQHICVQLRVFADGYAGPIREGLAECVSVKLAATAVSACVSATLLLSSSLPDKHVVNLLVSPTSHADSAGM